MMRKLWFILSLVAWGCGGAPAVETPVATAEVSAPDVVEEVKSVDPLAAPADVGAVPDDATVSPSGLAFKVIKPAPEGAKAATLDSTVTAHYIGWTTDGERFDSSFEHGGPATFPLDKVIVGWREGVGTMSEGEKRRFWIPESLAYKGKPGAPAGMLVFDVELVRVEEK